MPTAEERLRILRMIEEGKLSAEEGARLLAALNQSRKQGRQTAAQDVTAGSGRWIRLRVSDTRTGKTRVNMTIPLGLVNMGLQVGARFVPDVGNLDVQQLQEAVRSGVPGKILEVAGDEGELVEIFVE